MLQVNLDIVDLDPELGSKKKVKVKPWIDNPKAQSDLQRVIDIANEFESVAKAHLSEKHPTQRRSWALLSTQKSKPTITAINIKKQKIERESGAL